MGLERPKCLDYSYIGEDEQLHIKEDAPKWAKNEFEKYMRKVNPKPSEEGIVTHY